jgi:imidazolonepropionase-like amidohydrolase
VTAAEVLGISAEAGSLEPGKRADLIATAGSPLADVEQLRHVTFVMKSGEIFRHSEE